MQKTNLKRPEGPKSGQNRITMNMENKLDIKITKMRQNRGHLLIKIGQNVLRNISKSPKASQKWMEHDQVRPKWSLNDLQLT